MRLVLAITAVLAAAATASAAPKKGNLVRDNSKSISGYYAEILPGTYPSTCWVPDPSCVPESDYDYCEIEAPCDEPCGAQSLYFSGSTMEDGSKVISVSVDYYSYCILENVYVSYTCSATVSVPPATWTQKQKSATIKFSATLNDCSSYAYTYDGDYNYEEVSAPAPNPVAGTTVSLSANLSCKTLDKYKNKCITSSTYGGERYKEVYGTTENTCNLVSVPGLNINGKSKVLDSASFGMFKYFNKFLSLKGKTKGPK